MNDPIFYIHIPRTSGTIFGNILRCVNTYPIYYFVKEYLENKNEILSNEYTLLCGHVPYSATKTYEVDFRYATMLRNPIDRCLSHWKEVNSYLSIINSTLSLDQFIEHPIYKKLFNNYQSRYLGFFPDWTTIAGTNNAEHHLTFATMEMDIDDNTLYTNCISTLDKFEFIGIKEYFQESVLLAEKILKFSHYIPRKKRTDYSSYLSDNIMSFLKKSNEVDFEVYRYAVKKFWEKWYEYNWCSDS